MRPKSGHATAYEALRSTTDLQTADHVPSPQPPTQLLRAFAKGSNDIDIQELPINGEEIEVGIKTSCQVAKNSKIIMLQDV